MFSDIEPQWSKPIVVYTVRVKEHNGFRDCHFRTRAEAARFKEMAEDDGTYWGWQESLGQEVEGGK